MSDHSQFRPNSFRRAAAYLALPVAVGLAVSACTAQADTAGTASATGAVHADATYYASKTPYHPFQDAADYSAPPDGYRPVFVENVARHGSRFLSSKKYDDLAYQLWETAEDAGALTALGEEFGPELESLIEAHEKSGYGGLSQLGAQEHHETGRRLAERNAQLFSEAVDDGEQMRIVSSGKHRADQSAESFAEGLREIEPKLEIDDVGADRDLLYFHKSEANSDYQDYLENDRRLADALDAVASNSAVSSASRNILEQIFTSNFIDRLDDGEFDFVDHGKGKRHLDDVASAADCLYNLYMIAPGMAGEGDWDFDRFIPTEDARVMAYYSDAQNFYKKGPGFDGDDITFKMADVLLDDFFDQIQDKVDGDDDLVGDLRFTHAEVIMPFATVLGLPGSTEQVSEDELFSYEDNPWRGEKVTPMAANIQWELYEGADDSFAVRMFYNEEETDFKAGCTPLEKGSHFYDFDELKRCYGRS
jgi:hypothetical protein